ncbi:FAD-binding oxidoreductase [Kiloniella sp. EL199]|uniref:NAD(P)/FAD-dependent oxidoreductase n=1 Tax=Kiloniella sp. EL199 TaxID=2107581 RepID=UPI000EA248B5|nr:FAD-binding oxidoreductase [Kiloniella sp. EL199]
MKEITVIGAGIVGICTSLSLIEAGAKVQLIDRDAPGQGTSYGNAGVISPWSIIPQSMPGVWKNIPKWLLDPNGPVSVDFSHLPKLIPWALKFLSQAKPPHVHAAVEAMELLNQDNIQRYRTHLKDTGYEHLIQDSYYVHAYRNANAADLSSLEYKIRQEKGADLERVDASALQKLEPALTHNYKAAILIKGQARATSPGLIGEILANKFLSMGGAITRSNVLDLRQTGDQWRVKTTEEQIVTDNVVIAAGAWSTELLKPLGYDIPLQYERGYHAMFKDPGVALTHSIMDVDYKCVASSMNDGLRVAGQAEFADLEKPPTKFRANRMGNLARQMVPNLPETPPETWMGTRPSLPDSLPCIGEFSGSKNLYAAFGHSHYGLMMAPKTGALVADIVMNNPINTDLSAFKPERFTRK